MFNPESVVGHQEDHKKRDGFLKGLRGFKEPRNTQDLLSVIQAGVWPDSLIISQLAQLLNGGIREIGMVAVQGAWLGNKNIKNMMVQLEIAPYIDLMVFGSAGVPIEMVNNGLRRVLERTDGPSIVEDSIRSRRAISDSRVCWHLEYSNGERDKVRIIPGIIGDPVLLDEPSTYPRRIYRIDGLTIYPICPIRFNYQH